MCMQVEYDNGPCLARTRQRRAVQDGRKEASARKGKRKTVLAGAQLYLGVFYAEGQGVSPDPIEAYKWLELAKKGNGQDRAVATECQENLVAYLSDAQIEEAKRRAIAFVPRSR